MIDLTAAERERLVILAEECSEVIKLCMKITRFGYDTTHPNRSANNRLRLADELGHIGAIVGLMREQQDISYARMLSSQEEKKVTIGQYLHFQK